jgi:hypothetical protein
MNLEGELSSNITLDNKLKGTQVVYQVTTFHLVHLASLKFVALNDENLEQLQYLNIHNCAILKDSTWLTSLQTKQSSVSTPA